MPFILMTRAIDDSVKSQEALEECGFNVFIEPMFKVYYLPAIVERLERYNFVVATSKHGIIGMAQSTNERNMKVVTVGNSTMECATNLGFKNVCTVNGTVRDLLSYLKVRARGSNVLYVRGKDVSHDLQGSAKELDIEVEELILYETVASTRISPECGNLFTNGQISCVLFYSKGAAKIFMKLVAKKYREFLSTVSAYTMSRGAQEVLNAYRWQRVCVSEQPTEESLFRLLCNFQPHSRVSWEGSKGNDKV